MHQRANRQLFSFADDYSFGVLQASPHFEWFRKSSRLKVETDTRYTVRETFDTFPWPHPPGAKATSAWLCDRATCPRTFMASIVDAGDRAST
jgi:hypothetical protein